MFPFLPAVQHVACLSVCQCGNVLLDREGRCKLADFGVSTAVRESTLKQSGSAAGNSSVGAAGNNGQHRESSGHMFAGTAYYTAPEILASGVSCCRCISLGVVCLFTDWCAVAEACQSSIPSDWVSERVSERSSDSARVCSFCLQ